MYGRLPSRLMAPALLTLKTHSGNRKSYRLLLKSHIAFVNPWKIRTLTSKLRIMASSKDYVVYHFRHVCLPDLWFPGYDTRIHTRVFLQRQTETVHFMQVVPWLGVVPNKEGQLQQMLADDNFSPLVSLFKLASDEVLSNPTCINPMSYISMAKQAEVAGAYFLLVNSSLLLLSVIYLFIDHHSYPLVGSWSAVIFHWLFCILSLIIGISLPKSHALGGSFTLLLTISNV